MSIAFFTEMNFNGTVSRTHDNMRTEFAWMCALNATHYNINDIPIEEYDLGIVIIPKKSPVFDFSNVRKCCKQVAVMQEGPNWYWQDYTLDKQISYFNALTSADIIYVHNSSDKKYYAGLTGHSDVRILPPLMILDSLDGIQKVHRESVIIGGNFVSWYGGFDSFAIANEFNTKIYAPSMGRKQLLEEQLVTHLPYTNWTNWIIGLNQFKYAVHLMRTHAAGTFALNCAYLGIPCIGYEGLDTQEVCHPELTVKLGDLTEARKLAKLLKNDASFYEYQSKNCKYNYRAFEEGTFCVDFYEAFK